jgi:hypothetical protein
LVAILGSRAALRRQLLLLVATACSLAALAALLDPDRVATGMGEFLVGVNGYSQFYAIHVGVRLATAALALMAARQGDLPVLGDLTALFVLAQPAGRLVAALAIGPAPGFAVAHLRRRIGWRPGAAGIATRDTLGRCP